MDDNKKEFLVHMYNQFFNDINRHIMVVWQSIGVLIGAFAIFALVEKNILPLDYAVSLVILLSIWLFAHLIDASYWYNRNLVMIANIERQFLDASDLKEIHYYFGAHRPKNRMITHLKIQMALGVGLTVIVISYHLFDRVVPGFSSSFSAFEFSRSMPYILLFGSGIYIKNLNANRDAAYQEFINNSPGKVIDTSSVNYGVGHAHNP